MGQITITISDASQQALEAEARRQGVSIDAAVERTVQLARETRIAHLRQRVEDGQLSWEEAESQMDDDDALEWAVQEVRQYRREKPDEEQAS